MNREPTDATRLEPLSQALARAGAALRSQPLPAALGWPAAAGAMAGPAATAGTPAGTIAWPATGAAGRNASGLGLPALPWPRWQRWLAGSGATLCAAALMVSLLLMLTAPPLAEPGAGSAAAAHPALNADGGLRGRSTGFIPVVSAQRLGELTGPEAGPAWLVPGEWPRERLAALGLPFDPARAGESVRAELLVHASGDVLAVRVLAQ